ncbi:MAG: apolipoprotein N-acyltransferase [Acidobacteriota bacterium]
MDHALRRDPAAKPRPLTRGRWWLLALGAVAAGILWGGCFAKAPHPWLGCLALAPLFYFLDQERPGWLAFWHGMGFWAFSLWWIRATIETYGQLDPVSAVLGVLFVAAFQSLYSLGFGLIGVRLWRRWGAPALLGLPALWVALEWLKGQGAGGFPWNLAAYAWTDMPGALPLAAWIGAWGISFLVVFANVGFAMAIRGRRLWPAVIGVLVPAILLAVGGRWARGPEAVHEVGGLPVRVIQPNLPILVEWNPAAVQANYQTLLRLSRAACDEPGALLLWPESAAWPYSLQRDAELRSDVEGLLSQGCPVLLNSEFDLALPPVAGKSRDPEIYNSAFLVGKSGIEQAPRQDKRHLVPFGEYVPWRRTLTFLNKLARNAGEFTAGDHVTLLPVGNERLGLSLCYEVVFPSEVAETVRAGATVLATVTNDGWYGDTSAPWQHFRAAQFRAAENRRPLLRAALTGVSGIIGADGRVLAELGPGEQGVLRARVEGRSELSPFTRFPSLVPLVTAALAAGALAFVMLRR